MTPIRYKFFLILFLVLLALFGVLASPLFHVRAVTVSGNVTRSEAEVLRLSGLDEPVNIFAVSSRGVSRALKQDAYIGEVTVRRHFISRTIDLTIRERTLRGYVEFSPGMYLYIDEHGTVLEVASYFTEPLPVVVGLDVQPFTVGQLLDVTNQQSFNALITLSHLFYQHGLSSSVVRLSLQDRENTRIYINNLSVDIGDMNDAAVKIQRLAHILPELEARGVTGGFLDLTDTSQPARFRALT